MIIQRAVVETEFTHKRAIDKLEGRSRRSDIGIFSCIHLQLIGVVKNDRCNYENEHGHDGRPKDNQDPPLFHLKKETSPHYKAFKLVEVALPLLATSSTHFNIIINCCRIFSTNEN